MKVKKLTKVTFPSYVFFLFCSIEGSFQDEKNTSGILLKFCV